MNKLEHIGLIDTHALLPEAIIDRIQSEADEMDVSFSFLAGRYISLGIRAAGIERMMNDKVNPLV